MFGGHHKRNIPPMTRLQTAALLRRHRLMNACMSRSVESGRGFINVVPSLWSLLTNGNHIIRALSDLAVLIMLIKPCCSYLKKQSSLRCKFIRDASWQLQHRNSQICERWKRLAFVGVSLWAPREVALELWQEFVVTDSGLTLGGKV